MSKHELKKLMKILVALDRKAKEDEECAQDLQIEIHNAFCGLIELAKEIDERRKRDQI